MKNHEHTWERLAAQARRAPAEPAGDPPMGFATRVVALSFDARRRPDEFVMRYTLRALGVAAALAVICAVTNFNLLSADSLSGETGDDPVGELITQL